MLKICFIQDELKDDNFKTAGEKVNFQILKALCESGFFVDVFCKINNLKKNYNIHNITELAEKNFSQNILKIVSGLNYNLTFATDYIPADVVYLHKHTRAYKEVIVKSKIEALVSAVFLNKQYQKSLKENQKQIICTQKYKIILTPSTILKNDLINMLQVDGQKIYILPPPIDMPEHVKIRDNTNFTFGFVGNDFSDKGGYVLLKALGCLSDFNFNLKMIFPYNKIPFWLKVYIKIFNLKDKIEFLPWQNDMTDFYDNIDCLLMPSKKETFGMIALEAMSRGKIVVLSSRCGAKDIIEPDGNGFIFDVTKNPVRNLIRTLKYILVNKNDFENLRQKAVFTASVYNYEKFKNELSRIINKFAETFKED